MPATPEKPLRADHEVKLEQQPGFLDDYGASTLADPKVRVGNGERQPWPTFNGVESKRLTGQWVDEKGRCHVMINQAGQHLELLVAIVENGHVKTPEEEKGKKKKEPDFERNHNRLYWLGGDVYEGQRYSLFLRDITTPINDKSLQCGYLTLSSGRLTIDFEFDGPLAGQLGSARFEQVRRRLVPLHGARCRQIGSKPNLFHRQLDGPDVHMDVRTSHWFPPTPQQEAALPRFILDARVRLDYEKYLIEGEGARPDYVRPFAYLDVGDHQNPRDSDGELVIA